MAKLTMNVTEVMTEMRKAGIHCTTNTIADGIAMGVYPFGRISNVGRTGRRTLEIFRVDFYAWLESKAQPVSSSTYTAPIKLVHGM